MAERHRAAETRSDSKSRPKVEPAVVAGGGSIQAQAARLSDVRLPGAQRRELQKMGRPLSGEDMTGS